MTREPSHNWEGRRKGGSLILWVTTRATTWSKRLGADSGNGSGTAYVAGGERGRATGDGEEGTTALGKGWGSDRISRGSVDLDASSQ